MKRKYTFIIAAVLVLLLALTLFSVSSSADFGDFGGDSDFGGNSDFGLFDSDSCDGDFAFDIIFFLFRLLGYGPVGIFAFFVIVSIIILLFVIIIARGKKSGHPVAFSGQKTPQSALLDISVLKQQDPEFSEPDFQIMVSNLYIRLQNSWTAKNIEDLRPYLSDSLYSKSDSQLDFYRKNGTTNRIDRPTVLGLKIRGFKKNGTMDSVIVELHTRAVDYVVKDSDGSVVRGSKTAEKFMEYEWELVRSSGSKTAPKDEQTVHNCPNCGAPLNINRTARCEYCGSIITVKEFDWVLNSISAISQQTVGK